MGKFIDLTGQRFTNLTVIKRVKNGKNNHSRWLCKCDCGNYKEVFGFNLLRQGTKSCGCQTANFISKATSKKKNLNQRIYNIYCKIKGRCYNRRNPAYKNYGGRGIKMCDKWLDKESGFMNFYNWAIQNNYRNDLTIDRINVNGDYEPDNCRWATPKEQSNNRRNNHMITYKGKEYTVSQLSEYLDIKVTTLHWRITHGWGENELGLKVDLANKYKRNREV